MADNSRKGHIEFCNRADEVPGVVERFFKCVDGQDALFRIPDAVRLKVGWVLTELLINAVKHSGADTSKIHFELGQGDLKITRVDRGNPLRIKPGNRIQILEWPLVDFQEGQHFEIYRNGIDSLQVITTDAKTAEFLVKELYKPEISTLHDMSDHFGLMIIAKASNLFYYTFDRKTRSNIFSVTFDYKDE